MTSIKRLYKCLLVSVVLSAKSLTYLKFNDFAVKYTTVSMIIAESLRVDSLILYCLQRLLFLNILVSLQI